MRSLKYFLFVFVSYSLFGAQQKLGWTSSAFDQKVFVENKGQFNFKEIPYKIFYGANSGGVDIFFTDHGPVYRYQEFVPMSEKRREELEKDPSKAQQAPPPKLYTFAVEWLGADQRSVTIEAKDIVTQYYTYSGIKGKASAYKKIIYKDLYPNIDVEYVIPEKGGIKYSLILHPGADVSNIKMKYASAKNIKLDKSGNVIVKSEFGNFTDHFPVSYYQTNNELVGSAFKLNKDEISFSLQNYDNTQTLIIDPWTVNPTFTNYNAAYDVNYDKAGNVYIYGSQNPFKLMKINASGTVQWTFNATAIGGNDYGDFVVDEKTGTSYILEGFSWSGVGALKVNSQGIQTSSIPKQTQIYEFWRAQFDKCSSTIVVGGGTPFSKVQACTIDTNLNLNAPVNSFNSTDGGYHDVCLLALDPVSSNCFMATTQSFNYSTLNNAMIKIPVPALTPSTFATTTGYSFTEYYCIPYVAAGSAYTNGFNGMVCSPNFLYTYDGSVIKKWNKNTGALISQVNTGGTKYLSGGLTVDNCDHIYAGVGNVVKSYDVSLVQTGTFNLPDICFDVKINDAVPALYVCGKNFVSSFTLTANTPSMNFATTSSVCGACNGSASITNFACSSLSAVSFLWSPGGQTTQTASNLCSGTYTVDVTLGCNIKYTDTVTVPAALSGNFPANIQSNGTTVCSGTIVTLTASGGSSYSWNTGSTAATINEQPMITTTYSVTIYGNGGCSKDTSILITVNSMPVANAGNDTTICLGQTASLLASGGNNFIWSTGQTSANINTQPALNSIYTVTVYNSSGACSDIDTVNITVVSIPTANAGNDTNICTGQTVTLFASGGGSYKWSTGATTATIYAQPMMNSVYTVTVSDALGICFDIDTVNINTVTTPIADAGQDRTICVGEEVILIASGGNNYQWSTGATTNSIKEQPTGNSVYTVTVSNSSSSISCSDIDVVQINVASKPIANAGRDTTILFGKPIVLMATGGGAYSWQPDVGCLNCSDPSLSPSVTTTYTLTITDENNCTSIDLVTVFVKEPCDYNAEIFVPNSFSPNGDEQNDLLKLYSQDSFEKIYFVIYDRWGEKMFETTNIGDSWGGIHNGEPCNTGVYTYMLVYGCKNNPSMNGLVKKGNISLVR